jgi:hypothetical protein
MEKIVMLLSEVNEQINMSKSPSPIVKPVEMSLFNEL